MFPPGRARLATNPLPTGSLSNAMTIGIVVVASLAARVAVGPPVTMTSTLRRTNSAASSGRRSSFPLCVSILNDNVFPLHIPELAQTLPECLDAGRGRPQEVAERYPMRRTFVGCCASADKDNPRSKVHGAMPKIFLSSFLIFECRHRTIVLASSSCQVFLQLA